MGAVELFKATDPFVRYEGTLVVRHRLIGPIPKDRNTIRKWLESRIEGGSVAALQELIAETVEQMNEGAGFSEMLDELTDKVATGDGFKMIDDQLVFEGRSLKAGIKEAANVTYPGSKWPGRPDGIDKRKGLLSFMVERVFVDDDFIPLGMSEPSGTDIRVKHPKYGPRSAIGIADYVEQPKLSFTVSALNDCLSDEVWANIWIALQEIGIGAQRSMGYGKFDLVQWDRIA